MSIFYLGAIQSYVMEDLFLSNPTNQKLVYQCFYVGPDAGRFSFNKELSRKPTRKMELLGNEKCTLKMSYL